MQYHVNPTYQTQEKGFLRILTNVNTRNNDENIFFQPLLLEQQLDTIKMNLNMQNQQNLMKQVENIAENLIWVHFESVLNLQML